MPAPFIPLDLPPLEVGPRITSDGDPLPLAVQRLLAADEFDMTNRSPLTGLVDDDTTSIITTRLAPCTTNVVTA